MCEEGRAGEGFIEDVRFELGLEVGVTCPQVQGKERTSPKWETVCTRARRVKGRHRGRVRARACVLLLEVAGDKAGKTGDRAMEGVKYEPKKFAEWVRQSTLR